MPSLSRVNLQTSQRRGDGNILPTGPGHTLNATGGFIYGSCTNPGTLIRSSNLLFPFLNRSLNLDVDHCTVTLFVPPTITEGPPTHPPTCSDTPPPTKTESPTASFTHPPPSKSWSASNSPSESNSASFTEPPPSAS